MFNPLVYYTINTFFCTGKGGLYRKRGGVLENGRRCTGKKRGIVQEMGGAVQEKRGVVVHEKEGMRCKGKEGLT